MTVNIFTLIVDYSLFINMRKEKTVICKECQKEFKTKWNGVFCSHRCSAIFSNKNRLPLTEEQRKNISIGVKNARKLYKENYPSGNEHSKSVGSGTKGKYKSNVKSILNVSSRTASKILKRL